jgi:hypothetical protein
MMDCLLLIPLMGHLSVRTASLYFYIRSSLLACRQQVESLVFYPIYFIVLYFLPQRQLSSIRLSDWPGRQRSTRSYLYRT